MVRSVFFGLILLITMQPSLASAQQLSDIVGRGSNDEWRIQFSYNVGNKTTVYYSSVIPDGSGNLYFGTSRRLNRAPSPQDEVISLTSSGRKRWSFPLAKGETVRSSPVVANGRTYVIAEKHANRDRRGGVRVLALEASSGALKWETKLSPNARMGHVGRNSLHHIDGRLIALFDRAFILDASSGKQLKSTQAHDNFDRHRQGTVRNGKLYFVNSNTLFALSPSGQLNRTRLGVTLNRAHAAPAFTSDGRMLIGDEEGRVHAFDSRGKKLWSTSLKSLAGTQQPTVRGKLGIHEGKGLVFGGTKDGRSSIVFALNLDSGKVEWFAPARGDMYSGPYVSKSGTVHFTSENGQFTALNSAGKVLWRIDSWEQTTWSAPQYLSKRGSLVFGTLGDGETQGLVRSVKIDGR